MADNTQQSDASQRLVVVLGALLLLALAFFALTSSGHRVVESDADLPPLASPPPPNDADNLGTR